MSWLSKLLNKRRRERESFNARLQMEKDAQENVDTRLNILDIRLKNEGRFK